MRTVYLSSRRRSSSSYRSSTSMRFGTVRKIADWRRRLFESSLDPSSSRLDREPFSPELDEPRLDRPLPLPELEECPEPRAFDPLLFELRPVRVPPEDRFEDREDRPARLPRELRRPTRPFSVRVRSVRVQRSPVEEPLAPRARSSDRRPIRPREDSPRAKVFASLPRAARFPRADAPRRPPSDVLCPMVPPLGR